MPDMESPETDGQIFSAALPQGEPAGSENGLECHLDDKAVERQNLQGFKPAHAAPEGAGFIQKADGSTDLKSTVYTNSANDMPDTSRSRSNTLTGYRVAERPRIVQISRRKFFTRARVISHSFAPTRRRALKFIAKHQRNSRPSGFNPESSNVSSRGLASNAIGRSGGLLLASDLQLSSDRNAVDFGYFSVRRRANILTNSHRFSITREDSKFAPLMRRVAVGSSRKLRPAARSSGGSRSFAPALLTSAKLSRTPEGALGQKRDEILGFNTGGAFGQPVESRSVAASRLFEPPSDMVASGTNLSRELDAYFTRQARLPPAGTTAFDPRLTPAWAGLKLPV